MCANAAYIVALRRTGLIVDSVECVVPRAAVVKLSASLEAAEIA